jgi:hypothetical protein
MRTLLLATLLLAPAAALAKPKITSQTTGLYPSKACKTKIKGEDGSDPVLRCPALKGFDVEVSFSAINTLVSLTSKAGTDIKLDGAIGNKLEWRLLDGKPFAVLVEVGDNDTDDDGKPIVRNRRIEVNGLDGHDIHVKTEIRSKAEAQKAWAAARVVADATVTK